VRTGFKVKTVIVSWRKARLALRHVRMGEEMRESATVFLTDKRTFVGAQGLPP
jgi:hypothetical protein